MHIEEHEFLDDNNHFLIEIAMEGMEVIDCSGWMSLIHRNRDYMSFDKVYSEINTTDDVSFLQALSVFAGNAHWEWGNGNLNMWCYHLHEGLDLIQTRQN